MKNKEVTANLGIRIASVFFAAVLTAGVALPAGAKVGDNGDAEATSVSFFVSPNGDDLAAGTEAYPLKTIGAARDAIRALGKEEKSGGVTVYVRGGNYPVTETLSFTSEDSGSAGGKIIYKAYEGESVTVNGAVTLDPDGFRSPEEGDAVASRIKDAAARERVLVYDLGGSGINFDEEFTALYYGGERAVEARYPNTGYVLGFDDETEGHSGGQYQCDSSKKTFYDKSMVVSTWAQPVGVKIIGMFEIDWSTSSGMITSYNAETNRVGISATTGIKGNSGRYYYGNVIEELDVPGEYYIDRDTEKLYIYLPENYRDINIGFACCKESVIRVEADNITFDGINISGGYDNNITVKGSDISIMNSKVTCCGDVCVEVDGFRNYVYNNEISHSGGCAVNVYGGDDKNLIPSETTVDNNIIHDFGDVFRVYNGALYVEGIGFEISHNEIYRGPHAAILNVACDMTVEYNYIHDVCYEAGDGGAIYEGGWTANGSVYRYNLIKDIVNDMSIYYTPNAYYNDDAGGGKTFVSNILINIEGDAIACGGGRDNTITDNIIVGSGISYDQRTYYPGTGPNAGWTLVGAYPSGNLWKSLIPWYSSTYGYVNKTPAYATEAWAIRYPWTMLIKSTNVADLEDNYVPYAFGLSSVRNNLICGAVDRMDISSEAERLMDVRDNIYGLTPEAVFADYEGGDYSIPDDSPIYRKLPGFRACNFSQIGVQETE